MNRILLITTGGTLACTPSENGLVPTLTGVDIVEYSKYKDEFCKNALVHLYAEGSGLRDLAVQQKIFITFIKDDDFIGRTFRDRLFKDLEPASAILGWCQYEVKFTAPGVRGNYTINPETGVIFEKELKYQF